VVVRITHPPLDATVQELLDTAWRAAASTEVGPLLRRETARLLPDDGGGGPRVAFDLDSTRFWAIWRGASNA
jgi:hypothetical protein